MGIPITYRRSGEAVASYDYNDLASGTGIQEFFLAETAHFNKASYALIDAEVYSDKIVTELVKTGASPGEVFELGQTLYFPVEFNAPRTLKGTAFFNMTMGSKGAIAEMQNQAYLQCVLYKVNESGTAAQIAMASGAVVIVTGADATTSYSCHTNSININIPQTHFKRGEQLKLAVKHYVKTFGEQTHTFILAHDPKNRPIHNSEKSTDPSIATIKIPFKLDL